MDQNLHIIKILKNNQIKYEKITNPEDSKKKRKDSKLNMKKIKYLKKKVIRYIKYNKWIKNGMSTFLPIIF